MFQILEIVCKSIIIVYCTRINNPEFVKINYKYMFNSVKRRIWFSLTKVSNYIYILCFKLFQTTSSSFLCLFVFVIVNLLITSFTIEITLGSSLLGLPSTSLLNTFATASAMVTAFSRSFAVCRLIGFRGFSRTC